MHTHTHTLKACSVASVCPSFWGKAWVSALTLNPKLQETWKLRGFMTNSAMSLCASKRGLGLPGMDSPRTGMEVHGYLEVHGTC